ncbi:MDIS1-interacting receptor like kinase 2-like [Fagus crenata]
MAAMITRLDQMKSNRNYDCGESSHRRNDGERSHGRTNYGSTRSGGTLIPRVTKLNFPSVNGRNDPTSWICQPTEFDDNFGDLTKLKQIGTVRENQGHFERLLSHVGRLSPSQQVCCFISGLKGHLRVDVQALKPISLSAAVGLAHLYEAKCHSQQRLLSSGENEESLPLSLSTGKTIKKLTPIELNER